LKKGKLFRIGFSGRDTPMYREIDSNIQGNKNKSAVLSAYGENGE
jgi:hypothetical protein